MRPTYRPILNEKERASESFNYCGMGPDVGLLSFSLSNVFGEFIVNYRGLL